MDKPHIYKITNNVNGKYYYGVHNGSDTANYEGSGKLLKQAYKKHGKANFSKEILLWFDTEAEAYEYEGVIVSEKMINKNNPQCYNLVKGGVGGGEFTEEMHNKAKKWRKENKDTLVSQLTKAGRKAASLQHVRNIRSKTAVNSTKKAIESGNHVSHQQHCCPYCGKEGRGSTMKRWHFDNCANNPSSKRYIGE
jgi:hypothetical protein